MNKDDIQKILDNINDHEKRIVALESTVNNVPNDSPAKSAKAKKCP